MKFVGVLAVAVLGLTSEVAPAATISITDFDPVVYDAQVAHGSFFGEDFESEGQAAGEGEVGPSLVIDTGEFYALGGVGTGGTVRNLAGNTGTELALRDGNTFGRRDAVGGQWYLDSNDTYGIGWSVASTRLFDTVMFVLTDGSDAGGFLRIVVNGTDMAEQRTHGRLSNGNAQLVTISFETAVSSALIEMANFTSASGTTRRLNDGFSIDGVQVGIAAVPLPAPAGFLVVALAILGLVKRRKAEA